MNLGLRVELDLWGENVKGGKGKGRGGRKETEEKGGGVERC